MKKLERRVIIPKGYSCVGHWDNESQYGAVIDVHGTYFHLHRALTYDKILKGFPKTSLVIVEIAHEGKPQTWRLVETDEETTAAA